MDGARLAAVELERGLKDFVPIAFLVPHVHPSLIPRPISPTSVAPTLSLIVKTKLPSGNVGAPLVEVLGGGGN